MKGLGSEGRTRKRRAEPLAEGPSIRSIRKMKGLGRKNTEKKG
jgi:hypothetical protein